MSTRARVYVLNAKTGELVEGTLVSPITEMHIGHWRDEWRPYQIELQARAAAAALPSPQHQHWSWERKEQALGQLLAYRGFAVEVDGMTEGMAFHKLTEVARLESQRGKPLVYIEFVEAAPWNRASVAGPQRYRGVGSVLVRSAVSLSRVEGFQGRIALHSLRQADSFYRDTCGMTEIGPDADHHGLRYFEMTPSQAADFASRGERK